MDAYQRYIASPHWRAFRLEAITNSGGKCSCCGITENLVVHHKHYETLGQETFDDVIVFCNRCHKLQENDDGFVNIDFRILRALKPHELKAYAILKMDATVNHEGQYAEITYAMLCKLVHVSKKGICKLTKSLQNSYNLIRKERGSINKYHFTHPDEWML